MSAELETAAAELALAHGPNPQLVGAEDGTEDDWGDLVSDAAERLGLDPEHMSEGEWQHFQDVAAGCRATTMAGWLAHLQAAGRR